jgi:T-complex protein 1 subunit beta
MITMVVAHITVDFLVLPILIVFPGQTRFVGGRSIEHADFDGTERLALVLSGDIVSTFDTPDQVKLGECDLIEEASNFSFFL